MTTNPTNLTGIILAGGRGTRLQPLTNNLNKHLIPIADLPMILYPIHSLTTLGIRDLIIVTNSEYVPAFQSALAHIPDQFNLNSFRIIPQPEPRGVADALMQAEPHINTPTCVMLGDQLLGSTLHTAHQAFLGNPDQSLILLKQVSDPARYGIATLNTNHQLVDITEKPTQPQSDLAIAGIYFYPPTIFPLCRTLKPSSRGELEISDLNATLLKQGKIHHTSLQGWWADVGTFDSLDYARQMVARHGFNND
ncbi:Glucose-1-phosphate thymidylyltransferase [Poriferisphaera corsica]|uniref:glucose-1-phosphate thymidylyltransferase n=1 Tax=Poriferisphaera corsica TaxID=2528020 RepID=A0A517YY23_9BACT|nr:sugar nucleotidyltransferase [Poriferisphaera corsica]QDU35106.1 Glucose-1-phosphate thymidylyltransferase [Poriferisphaera corsica]